MHGGWKAERRISAGRLRCSAEGQQAKIRGLAVEAQGARQLEAGRGQVHHGRCDCHADCFACKSGGGRRIQGIRLQQLKQPCGHVFPAVMDPEPCLDVAMDHVVERMLHGEIVQMKRERLIRITRCHVVESIMSQYCGWQSRAGVVR